MIYDKAKAATANPVITGEMIMYAIPMDVFLSVIWAQIDKRNSLTHR